MGGSRKDLTQSTTFYLSLALDCRIEHYTHVCDTPELWRGAAGLCARVRACAGAAEYLHTYIHRPTVAQCSLNGCSLPAGRTVRRRGRPWVARAKCT